MNKRVISEALVCPICKERVKEVGKSLICPSRHTYDIAKSGYVNLAGPKQQNGGDSVELIRARTEFLNNGYYERFSNEINRLAEKYMSGGIIADAGCGEGYYTNRLSSKGFDVFGFDLSKCGVENGAKASKRLGTSALFAIAGIYSIPISDNSLDGVVNIFAPCAESEFSRVLKKDGYLIVAGAGEDHLYGLKSVLYDTVVKNEERADLPENMKLVEKTELKYDIEINDRSDIMALFSMTPYYYRTSDTSVVRLKNIAKLTTAVDFNIYVYKK